MRALAVLGLLLFGCDAELERIQLAVTHDRAAAAGLVEGAPDQVVDPEPVADPDSDPGADPDPVVEPDPDPDPGVEPDPGPDPDPVVEPDPDPVVEPDLDPDPVVDPDPDPPPSMHPAIYPADRVHSPLTPAVVQRLTQLAATQSLNDDAFMKVGASSTESAWYLACFAGPHVALDGRLHLQTVIDRFDVEDAAGTDPFSRQSLAAKSGRSAGWAIGGAPSPLEREFEALAPRFAMVHYGANDMQLGTSYQSASWGFADNLLSLVDQLLAWGVVPVVSTITRRLDLPAADRWVPTYNAIIRAVAQGRQVPLYDMGLALEPLPQHGLSGDGLHPSVYRNGGAARACDLGPEGLSYGYNARNLEALEALGRVAAAVVDGAPAPDAPGPALAGDGGPDAPIVIDALPFTDLRDTAASPWSELDVYAGCGATQDESGPEVLYRLELDTTTAVRAMVFDRGPVDVDLHLLDETATEEGCLDRAHGAIEATLSPGTYHFALDSWVDGDGDARAGEYLFVVLACAPDDPSCG